MRNLIERFIRPGLVISPGKMRARIFTTVATILARSAHSASAKPIRNTRLRLGTVAFVAGAGGGGLFAYEEYRKRRAPKTVLNSDDPDSFLLKAPPSFEPSRSVTFPMDMTGLKLTLYQYQTCPFCCKVRAMLDYFGISYGIVEVNPVLRTQLKWSEKYRKVPILIVETPEGEVLQLNDSSMIISALFSYVQNQNKTKTPGDHEMLRLVKCYPTVKFQDEDGKTQTEIMNKYFVMEDMEQDSKESKEAVLSERKWRKWADSVYVHTLSPNIYRTLPEAIASFRNFDRVGEWEKNFAAWERTLVIYTGAVAMWMIGKRLQKRHHLKEDVRQSLYEESEYWLRSIHQKGKGDFMGGSKPNLSDLAVYGILNSIEGCEAFDDLAKNSKIISQWYRKVQQHLKNAPNKVEIVV
ncbi:unnamed protein product [Allacma fusca]|uniref:Prostaglandin E synthase 2 n=1 Tax=Allacma fusca TaxID=39272 RepID=A0A8J2PXA0_9HEXA|nr:unnamed protein product [Allacma fusca]